MTEKEYFDIIFLRHGESVGNAEARWQGQADYPLTKKGRRQARALAERWQNENRTFDTIITSPLRRASETAKIIASVLNLPLETDPIWAERFIGEAAGLTTKEVRQRFPERRFTNPYSAIIENEGEGDWELYLRSGRALQGLLRREPGKYLVVSHGGLLNQLMYAVVGTTPQANASGPRFRFKNTGFAYLIYYPDSHRWQIDAINDRAHWNGKGPTER